MLVGSIRTESLPAVWHCVAQQIDQRPTQMLPMRTCASPLTSPDLCILKNESIPESSPLHRQVK
jgi:hypothetical protein